MGIAEAIIPALHVRKNILLPQSLLNILQVSCVYMACYNSKAY